MSRNWLYLIPALAFAAFLVLMWYPHFPKAIAWLSRLWDLIVCRYVLWTGKGKRSRQWRHYVRSEGSRKAWITRKANIARRNGERPAA